MKRDRGLQGLSSDHHHALVLARKAASGASDAAALVREAWQRELRPHFDVEEQLLLPALAAAGEAELVARTRREHEQLAGFVAALDGGDPAAALEGFGRALEEHVRFEERVLFDTAQRVLDPAALAAVGHRRPPPK